jgi:hypothetical protein
MDVNKASDRTDGRMNFGSLPFVTINDPIIVNLIMLSLLFSLFGTVTT